MNRKSIIRNFKKPLRSFFLFGPRGTGKSTWLKHMFKNDIYIDLPLATIKNGLHRQL